MNLSNFHGGDWQNFSYLVVLLVILLSSLFARRDLAYSKIFKTLGVWGLIAFIFVVLYSYRFEFSDFKNRILGEINPSKAMVDSDGKLVINIAQDGHFYLNVKVNQKPVRFMIDTGASDITLSMNDAITIGINPKELNFNKIYQTANGKSFGANVTLNEIEVAGIKFREVGASVNNSDMGVSLLGMSFLRKFRRYEFYQDKLLLEI